MGSDVSQFVCFTISVAIFGTVSMSSCKGEAHCRFTTHTHNTHTQHTHTQHTHTHTNTYNIYTTHTHTQHTHTHTHTHIQHSHTYRYNTHTHIHTTHTHTHTHTLLTSLVHRLSTPCQSGSFFVCLFVVFGGGGNALTLG